MSAIHIPGLSAGEWVVGDELRRQHGDDGCVRIAMGGVEHRMRRLLNDWPSGSGLTVRVVLTLDPPHGTVNHAED